VKNPNNANLAPGARRSAFYGDDGSSADYSQRHAGNPGGGGDAEQMLKAIRAAYPNLPIWKDSSVMTKRLSDVLEDSQAGFDTTMEEDARLRQTSPGGGTSGEEQDRKEDAEMPEADEHTAQAERTARDMQSQIEWKYRFADPKKRAEFVEALAQDLRGGPAQQKARPETQQTPMLSRKAYDDFLSNPKEMQRIYREKHGKL